nr:hypothetical protein [Mycoplasmopsis bovis]
MNSTVLIKNEKIHYIFEDTSNDIPVLLFVHGFKDRSKTIQPLISIKNRNYAIYALDLPGCGESSKHFRRIFDWILCWGGERVYN